MWQKVVFSFPVQLLALHLKKNLFLVAIWVLLAFIVLQGFGTVLGIPFLFLDPEYLNEVSWKSFMLVGLALSIFTMAFHMTTYILDGAKFKFLAVIPRPFVQYCLNNSILPLIFYIIFVFAFFKFQLNNEHDHNRVVWEYFFGFVLGSVLSYTLIFLYFTLTNKDFFILFAGNVEKQLKRSAIPRATMLKRIKESQKSSDVVLWYLDTSFRIRPVRRDLAKFETHQLLRVFDQNHLNMVIIQTVLIALIFLMGIFRENPYLQIPAASSAILLLAILTMVVGAVSFWLREWSTPGFFLAFFLFNYFSNTAFFNRPHEAYGLDYDKEPAPYDLKNLQQLLHRDSITKDREQTLQVLENWKAKFPEGYLPKMVFVTASGGGQRAALWTLHVLQQAEEKSKRKLFKHTQLITGASGGMIGAAFFRELYLRHGEDPAFDPMDKKFLEQISADNLNPIIYTLLVNDLLIRTQYFEYNGRKYLEDRGYAFERQLNINTEGLMEKTLGEYRLPELQSRIPQLLITPLITNDGRKLLISPFSVSYLGVSVERNEGWNEKSQGIDFKRFFADHDPSNLRFLSALRMGATFPFITPNVQLPSQPRMETMDAGLSDNYGIQDALKFIDVFKDWIEENTSGVVLLTIRDSEKFSEIDQQSPPRFLERFFTPLKNIYSNWDNVQTLNNEVHFTRMQESLPFSLERIEFEYSTKQYMEARGLSVPESAPNHQTLEIERASLNWRLTAKEKRSILENMDNAYNRKALDRVSKIEWLRPKD